MDIEQSILRAKEAKDIIDHPLVKEAFVMITENIVSKWQASKISEKDIREDAWKMLHAMNEFKRYFELVLQNGKVAEHEKTRSERFKEKVSSIWKY